MARTSRINRAENRLDSPKGLRTAFRFESRRARLANANLDPRAPSATGVQLRCNPVAVLAGGEEPSFCGARISILGAFRRRRQPGFNQVAV